MEDDKTGSWMREHEELESTRGLPFVLDKLLDDDFPPHALLLYLACIRAAKWKEVIPLLRVSDSTTAALTPRGQRVARKLVSFLKSAPGHLFQSAGQEGQKDNDALLFEIGEAKKELDGLESGEIRDPGVDEVPAADATYINGDLEAMNADGVGLPIRLQQSRQVKRPRVAAAGRELDKRCFNNLNISPPTSLAEAIRNTRPALAAKECQIVLRIVQRYIATEDVGEYLETQAFQLPKKPVEEPANLFEEVVQPEPTEEEETEKSLNAELDLIQASPFPEFITPLKAAQLCKLGKDSTIGIGIASAGAWHVELSDRAVKDWEKQRDASIITKIMRHIVQLSQGRFSKDNMKVLVGKARDASAVPIYEARMHIDLRIIWTVICALDSTKGKIVQRIRIFGIVSHSQMNHQSGIWDAIANESMRYTPEYRKRCEQRNQVEKVDNICMPMEWADVNSGVLDVDLNAGVSPNDVLDEDERLQLQDAYSMGKYTPFSGGLVKSLQSSTSDKYAHVFSVSDKEEEIVNNRTSMFVLGRSGTGKTTCMVFRMLGLGRAYKLDAEARGVPLLNRRMLFITQSAVLCQRVKEYYNKLSLSADISEMTEAEMKRAHEERERQSEDSYDESDEKYGMEGLPTKWSELQDDHFPLFLSFSQLCSLLEADYDIKHESHLRLEQRFALRSMRLGHKKAKAIGNSATTSVVEPVHQAAPFIDFSVFKQWWPTFNKHLTGKLDPSIVYSEMMGVLRGSDTAMASEKGYIDLETYRELSGRAHDMLFEHREHIYDIMLAYLRKKSEVGGYDAADRTRALLQAMKRHPLPLASRVKFLSVDEAQDQLLGDCQLLRMLCFDPNGFFFAGDTAQTVNHLTFRFEDLKAVFWRLEQDNALVKRRKREAIMPADFQLHVNFRSHTGITKLSSFIVESIINFWPNSIDKLKPEEGQNTGPKPQFSVDATFIEQFNFEREDRRIEFGADQCLIVRDDERRDRMRQQMGDAVIIMTVPEAKGLEFNDVIFFEPFTDSAAQKQEWRVLLNMLPADKRGGEGVPGFEPNRHALLCQELKAIYVAVTRTRFRLFLHDSSPSGNTIRTILLKLDLVKLSEKGAQIGSIAVESTPEEWERRGKDFVDKQPSVARYQQAEMCFRRANRYDLEAFARAKRLTVEAKSKNNAASRDDTAAHEEVRRMRLSAAEAFMYAASESRDTSDRLKWYKEAGDRYDELKQKLEAAQCYEKGESWSKALKRYQEAGEIDMALDLAAAHRDLVSEAALEATMQAARVETVRRGDITRGRKLFNDKLDDLQQFAIELHFSSWSLPFLIDGTEYEKAAQIRRDRGEYEEAARFYGMSTSAEAARSQLECLFVVVQRTIVLGSCGRTNTVSKESEAKRKRLVDDCLDLLAIQRRVTATDAALSEMQDELDLCKALVTGDIAALRNTFVPITSATELSKVALLCICADFLCQGATEKNPKMILAGQMTAHMLLLRSALSLVSAALNRDRVHPALMRCFGVVNSLAGDLDDVAESTYSLLPVSPLYQRYASDKAAKGTVTIGARQLLWDISNYLTTRTFERLTALSDALKASALTKMPCLDFLLGYACPRAAQCQDEHIRLDALEDSELRARIDLMILTLDLLFKMNTLASVQSSSVNQAELRQRQKYWFDRLVQIAYAPLSLLHVSGLLLAGKVIAKPMVTTRTAADKLLGERLFLLDEKTGNERLALQRFSLASWAAFDLRTNLPQNLKLLHVYEASALTAKDASGLPLQPQPLHEPIPTHLAMCLEGLQTESKIARNVLAAGINWIRAMYGNNVALAFEPSIVVHNIETITALAFLSIRGSSNSAWEGLLLPAGILRNVVLRYTKREIQAVADSFVADLLSVTLQTLAIVGIDRSNSNAVSAAAKATPLYKIAIKYKADMLQTGGAKMTASAARYLAYRLLRTFALFMDNASRYKDQVLRQLESARLLVKRDPLYDGLLDATSPTYLKEQLLLCSARLAGTDERLQVVKLGGSSTAGVPKGVEAVTARDLPDLFQQLAEGLHEPMARTALRPRSKLTVKGTDKEQKAASQIVLWMRDLLKRWKKRKITTLPFDPELRKAREAMLGDVAPPSLNWSWKACLANRSLGPGRSGAYRRLVFGPGLELNAAIRVFISALQAYHARLEDTIRTVELAEVDDLMNEALAIYAMQEELKQYKTELESLRKPSTAAAESIGHQRLAKICADVVLKFGKLGTGNDQQTLLKPSRKKTPGDADFQPEIFSKQVNERINDYLYLAHRGIVMPEIAASKARLRPIARKPDPPKAAPKPGPAPGPAKTAKKSKKPAMGRMDDSDDDDDYPPSSKPAPAPKKPAKKAAPAAEPTGESDSDDMPPLEAIEDSGDESAPAAPKAAPKPPNAKQAPPASKQTPAAPKPQPAPAKATPAAAKATPAATSNGTAKKTPPAASNGKSDGGFSPRYVPPKEKESSKSPPATTGGNKKTTPKAQQQPRYEPPKQSPPQNRTNGTSNRFTEVEEDDLEGLPALEAVESDEEGERPAASQSATKGAANGANESDEYEDVDDDESEEDGQSNSSLPPLEDVTSSGDEGPAPASQKPAAGKKAKLPDLYDLD